MLDICRLLSEKQCLPFLFLSITDLRLLKQVGRKEMGTHDALHAHKGYRYRRSLLNLKMKMLEGIGVVPKS